MQVINVEEYQESIVIHFGTEAQRINAYTLASTLISLADAAKSANAVINPGYGIEVVVEALGPGSFRAKIRTVHHVLQNLWNKQEVRSIILSIIASYIYQHTLASSNEVNVIVDDSQVVIEQNDKKIIIPRTVHDALVKVEKSSKFQNDVGKAFETIENDDKIESFGITKNINDKKPDIEIPRDFFPLLTAVVEEPDLNNTRTITEIADLQILRAILKRSKRRWEFVWRGVKISAPVLDKKFYNDFFARKITIAPGDSLRVRLKIYQEKDSDTGIFTNKKYEVIEVLEHVQSPKQSYLI